MKQESKKIKVLIADDHGIVRAGLASILGFEDDIAVVGEANNGLHAVAQCKALRPDVIIMDLMMPQLNGVEATVRITREMPETKVMILTTYGSADDIGRALEAGAAGAMIKTVSNDTLVSAIRPIRPARRTSSRLCRSSSVSPGRSSRNAGPRALHPPTAREARRLL